MGHGTHWRAVLKNFDEDFAAVIGPGIQNGAVIGARHHPTWIGPSGPQAANVTLIQGGNSGFGALAILVTANSATYLHSAFPAVNTGPIHRLRILDIRESSFGLEACITAQIGESVIHFFDPYYALQFDVYRRHADLDVALTAIVHHLSIPDRGQTVMHPQIGETHLDGAAMLLAIREPEPSALPAIGFGLAYVEAEQNGPGFDDYQFRGPIKQLTAVDFLGRPAWRMTATPDASA